MWSGVFARRLEAVADVVSVRLTREGRREKRAAISRVGICDRTSRWISFEQEESEEKLSV